MTSLMIAGSDGSIEIRYHCSLTNRNAPLVIIAPPHPLQEGSMDHRVIYALFRTFAALKFNVLRFNFRGCGKTEGTFSEGEDEISDAAVCLDWLLAQNLSSPQCWVIGFSFGAWVGMQLLMRRPECVRFISINPPTNLYDFGFLAPCPVSGLFIHGEEDEITPKESTLRLVHHLSLQRKRNKIDFRVIKQADHSFTNKTDKLSEMVTQYVKSVMDQKIAAFSHVGG